MTLGASYISEITDCSEDTCRGDYKFSVSAFNSGLVVTPRFDLLFPEGYQFGDGKSFQFVFHPRTSHNKSAVVAVTLSISGLDQSMAASLSECAGKVGQILTDKLSLYKDSNVVSLKTGTSTGDEVSVFDVDQIDYSVVYVSHPSRLVLGEAFPLEVKVIPSERLGADRKLIDLAKNVEATKAVLQKLQETNSTTEQTFEQVSNVITGIFSDLSKSQPSMQPETLPNRFVAASVKLQTSPELTVSSNSNKDSQTLKPLQSASWSWIVTPKKSGDNIAYLVVSASNAAGEQVERIIPLHMQIREKAISIVYHFLSDHAEWLAGTLVIPFGIFLWKRRQKPATNDPEPSKWSDPQV